MSFQRSGLSLTVAILLIGSGAWAQTAGAPQDTLPSPLTLSRAIDIALARQPQIYVAASATTQALGHKEVGMSQYYPTITPTYSAQASSDQYYGGAANGGAGSTIVGGTGSETIVPSTSSGVNFVRGGGLSIAASQTLFDSGKREQLNAQLRHEVQAARFGQEDECQQVIYSVTNAYYGLLEATDLTKVADAQVNRYNEVLNLTKAQAALGAIAPMDIDQAQADLATAQVTLIQDQNGVHTASATLKNVMGVESNEQVVPSALAQGTDLPAMPAVADTVTLDQAVQTAYNSRPDLKQQAAVVQSDVAATKSAELDAKLSLSSTVALAYQATNDVGSRGLDTQVQVVASYPLFDAGATRGAIREAAGARDGAVDQLIAARQNVREAVEQQYYSRAETIEAARLAQVAVKAAQTTFDAAVASRKAGVSTIVDVTTAQATLTQAQDQYVEAVYEYYIADAALARAMGTNDTGVAH